MRKKIIFLLGFLLVFNISIIYAESPTKVSPGINSYIKKGDNFYIYIQKEFKKPFKGYIEIDFPILVNDYSGKERTKYIKYKKEIEIKNKGKQDLSFKIPNLLELNRNGLVNFGNNKKHTIKFLDKNKKIIDKESVLVEYRLLDSRKYLLGVLSEKSDLFKQNLDSIQGNNLYKNDIEIISLDKNFKLTQLEMLDTIAVDGKILNNLSESKKNILKEYVSEGGKIIFSLDFNFKKPIEEFLPIKINNKKLIKDEKLGIFKSIEGFEIQGENIKSKIDSILYTLKFEKGEFIIYTFDFTDPIFENYFNKKMFFQKTIVDNKILKFEKDEIKRPMIADYNLSEIPLKLLPNLMKIFNSYIFYIILLGPISYFILKRIDKLEWLLISIFIFSIFYLGIIVIKTNNTPLKDQFINVRTLISYNKGDLEKRDLIGIKNGNSKKNQFIIPKGDLTLSYKNSSISEEKIMEIEENSKGYKIKYNQFNADGFRQIELFNKEESNIAKPILVIGSNGKSKLKVQNNFGESLKDIHLVLKSNRYNKVYDIGEVQRNKSKNFEFNLENNFKNFYEVFDSSIVNTALEIQNDSVFVIAKLKNYKKDEFRKNNPKAIVYRETHVLIPVDLEFNGKIDSFHDNSFFKSSFEGENTLIGNLDYYNLEVDKIKLELDEEVENIKVYNYKKNDYDLIDLNGKKVILEKNKNPEYFNEEIKVQFKFSKMYEVFLSGDVKND